MAIKMICLLAMVLASAGTDATAHGSGWSMICAYVMIQYMGMQADRVARKFRPNNVVIVYVDILASILFQSLSLELFQPVALVAFVFTMITLAESLCEYYRLHVIITSTLFIATHILSWNHFGIRASGVEVTGADGSTSTVHIEYQMIPIVVLLGVFFSITADFYRRFALELMDREANIHSLFVTNVELQSTLNKFAAARNKVDVEAPIDKIVEIIDGIKKKSQNHAGKVEAEVLDNLDFALSVLSSNDIYAPDLQQVDAVDTEVQQWLKTLLQTEDSYQDSNDTSEASRSQSRSSMRMDKRESRLYNQDATISRTFRAGTLIAEVLANRHSWDFDVFKLAEISNGRPLFYIGQAIFEDFNLAETFHIHRECYLEWLTHIEKGYKITTPYHNSLHAADVTHGMFYFLLHNEMHTLPKEDIFASIIAAIIHDYNHPGRNNAFLINTSDNLAIRYNDHSVLENHHVASALNDTFSNENINIFQNMSISLMRDLREKIVDNVLATDMARHFEFLGKFKNKMTSKSLNLNNKKDRTLLCQTGVKCADISNPAKNHRLARLWAGLIMEEFYKQGDLEKENNMPVSMFMDRTDTRAICKCQIGFIDFLVAPLYNVWTQHGGENIVFMNDNIQANREKWDELNQREDPVTSLELFEENKWIMKTIRPAKILVNNGGTAKDVAKMI